MITPSQYEQLVAAHFESQGFDTKQTQMSGDYGVDVFASDGKQKLAIQAKLYGSSRPINRDMVFLLHGAKDYFECTRGVLVTDGVVRADAQEVANKLDIVILHLAPSDLLDLDERERPVEVPAPSDADRIWKAFILPLAGRLLQSETGLTNKITAVDWTAVVRVSKNGKSSSIPYEVFRRTINHLITHGQITRDEINEEYPKRASSGVVLILSQVPFFEMQSSPKRLILNRQAFKDFLTGPI